MSREGVKESGAMQPDAPARLENKTPRSTHLTDCGIAAADSDGAFVTTSASLVYPADITKLSIEYTDCVTCTYMIPQEEAARLTKLLTDATAGRAKITCADPETYLVL